MVGMPGVIGLSVLLCLTDSAVSVISKCRVASLRVVGSFTTTCDIQFGYTTSPPDWIDQLQVVESFRNATDEQLDAFAKEACRCRMLRVHRHCPSDLFELIRGVAWRCFPGAREAVSKDIADTSDKQGQDGDEKMDGGGEGRVDDNQSTLYTLQATEAEEESKVEGSGTDEMSTTAPKAGITATDGTTEIENGEDESGEVTSVGSIDVPSEERVEDDLEITHDSSDDVTEQPSALEGRFITGPEDSTDEPAGENPGEMEDEKDTQDTGSGEELKEEFDDEGSTEDMEGSVGEEETAVSPPVPEIQKNK